jgi:hypothetical protein
MEEFGNLMLELINDLMPENNTIYLSIKASLIRGVFCLWDDG